MLPSHKELILIPILDARPAGPGRLRLTRKYLEGVEMYQRYWPGPVTTLVGQTEQPLTDLDPEDVAVSEPGGPDAAKWRVERRPEDHAALEHRLRDAAVVLGFLGPTHQGIAASCRKMGVPFVTVSEYSLKTELQIVTASVKNPIIRLRRHFWHLGAERKRLQTLLSGVAGIQCSGTPTYEIYRLLHRNALLFFDNRVRSEDVVSDEELGYRVTRLLSGGPLRLVFGGRFVPMKGVLELPVVAECLREQRVRCTLDVYGDGPLRPELLRQIEARGLGSIVRVHGPLDFRTGWLPVLRDADLFLCPHPQGDPSSTYPEVMSCGTVIAGYANEALRGVAELSRGGFTVPIGDRQALARLVARLGRDREAIAKASVHARNFALEHCFERTFERRTRHLIGVSRLPVGALLDPPRLAEARSA